MQINSINSNVNFGARLSKNVAYSLDRQGMDIYKRFGHDSYEFKSFQHSMDIIEHNLPDAEICYPDNKKFSANIVIKRPNKPDVKCGAISAYKTAESIAAAIKGCQYEDELKKNSEHPYLSGFSI